MLVDAVLLKFDKKLVIYYCELKQSRTINEAQKKWLKRVNKCLLKHNFF